MYIVKIKYSSDDKISHYVRHDGVSKLFDEIQNPNYATQFSDKNAAQTWITDNISHPEYYSVANYNTELQNYYKWISSGSTICQRAIIDHNLSRPYTNESPDEVLKWTIACKNPQKDSSIKYEHYKTCPQLYTQFKHIWDVEYYSSDDYKQKYLSFSIYTPKNGKIDEFIDDLNKVNSKVSFLDGDYLVYSIFDHYLCEDGGVSLLIYNDGKPVTSSTPARVTNRRGTYDKCKGDISKCFEYLKRERYCNEY